MNFLIGLFWILPAITALSIDPKTLYALAPVNGVTACIVPLGCRSGMLILCPACYFTTIAPVTTTTTTTTTVATTTVAPEICVWVEGGNCGLPDTCPAACLEVCTVNCLLANQMGTACPASCFMPTATCC